MASSARAGNGRGRNSSKLSLYGMAGQWDGGGTEMGHLRKWEEAKCQMAHLEGRNERGNWQQQQPNSKEKVPAC